MLKQVVLVIKVENLDDEEIGEKMEETTAYVKECGYCSEIYVDDGGTIKLPRDLKKEESLFLTDSPERAGELLDEGAFVVGIINHSNRGQDFSGVKYLFEEIENVDIDSFVKVYQRYSGEPWEILRTDRLLVRETTLEDVDEFYRIYKNPEITRYMEGLFDNPEDEKRYQRDYIEKVYGLMGFGVWTLVRLSDNHVIGRAGYSVRNGFDEIELGFLVGSEYQRQGYAMEACRAILDYGRDVLQFESVQTLVKAENTVSIHICESLGFEKIDEVSVEENIYGSVYKEGQKAVVESAKIGKYVRMSKKF